jgi:hypothetical protein
MYSTLPQPLIPWFRCSNQSQSGPNPYASIWCGGNLIQHLLALTWALCWISNSRLFLVLGPTFSWRNNPWTSMPARGRRLLGVARFDRRDRDDLLAHPAYRSVSQPASSRRPARGCARWCRTAGWMIERTTRHGRAMGWISLRMRAGDAAATTAKSNQIRFTG